jgi:HK97 family phage major capsid protein
VAVNLNEIRQKRVPLILQSRAILDRYPNETVAMSAEDETQYNKIHEEIRELTRRIEREQDQADLETDLDAPQKPGVRSKPDGDKVVDFGEYRTGHKEVIKLSGDDKAARHSQPLYQGAWRTALRSGFRGMADAEMRALQADSDIAGGYLIPPQQFVASLIQFVNDQVFVRQYATKFPLMSAETMGVPALDNDPADADWTQEIVAATEDTTMTIGKRQLQPHPLSKLLKVSQKLLRQSSIDVEALVRERLGYKFSITQEKGFLTGNGHSSRSGSSPRVRWVSRPGAMSRRATPRLRLASMGSRKRNGRSSPSIATVPPRRGCSTPTLSRRSRS